MLGLTILSPHRDDAAFSLSFALFRWSGLGLDLKVVNFFTISEYGPLAASSRKTSISSLRGSEDRSVLFSINNRIRMESLDLLDAPLRLDVSSAVICEAETIALQPEEETHRLATHLQKQFARGLVLAPLALGNHVDHITVNRAAITAGRGARLGFYEDLPYATWTPESCVRRRVSEIEQKIRIDLKPAIIRSVNCTMWRKLRLIGRYRTQIAHDEAIAISRYALRYRGGERIWIPKYGASWSALTQCARQSASANGHS